MQAAFNLRAPAYHQGPVWYLKIPMEVMDREPGYGVGTKHIDFWSPIKATESIHSRGANQPGKKDDASQVCQSASPSATTAQVQSGNNGGRIMAVPEPVV